MKVFVGLDFEGKPISVLLADSAEKAHIAWAGMKDTPHSVEEIDPLDEDLGVHGVVFLLTSKKRRVGGFGSNSVDYREFKRGL